MCTYNRNYSGNSVLAELPSAGPKRRYLHIGARNVSVYELDDVITGYASPVPNNDSSTEFAVGQKNIYLFAMDIYIPKGLIDVTFEDPYDQFARQLGRRYKLAPIARTTFRGYR